ncbi:MAG: GTP-binding protein [Candidatus Lokiarchaeota archaeon]|nr:GTP-binding protein [Candidatus Lokiarchaeota archaeon]
MSYYQKEILFNFKTVICGASSVGKTCLFNRYCFNSFNFDTSPTIGINFHSVYLKINLTEDPNTLKENYVVNSIFDFGGQERFTPLIPKFIEGANGALLVFDSVNFSSFNQLDFWYNTIIENAVDTRIPIILVGSKSDLIGKTSNSEIVSDELIFKFLKERNLRGFHRTSALENYNVLEVFKNLNNLMLKKRNISYDVV